ncbi:MAG: mannonate dehydratase [Fimbriimonadaceae bacterium]|nr:mannonate dehydratase [Fimbriimonadaceae bacterium]
MATTEPRAEGYPLVIPGYYGSRPGIQIGTQLAPTASDDELRFARQLGVEWVMTMLPDGQHTLDDYRALQRRFADFGLRIYRLANHRCHNMEAITLATPEREARLAEYLDYLRLLGAAGIRYATYAHMANGIWSSERETVRGGAPARALRLDRDPTGWWIEQSWRGELTHGRRYGEQELWDNFAWFLERAVPVAEEAGVYLGIHPDDPPVYDLGGIPRCIAGTFAGYQRALALADSPNVGVCLCVGCWLEGGPAMGADVVTAIREFGGQGKLFKIHLRNVTAPLPEGFVETFLDDGYQNMVEVVRALHEVGFTGALISDHLPQMVGGRYAAEGYAVGYMRALIQAVAGP